MDMNADTVSQFLFVHGEMKVNKWSTVQYTQSYTGLTYRVHVFELWEETGLRLRDWTQDLVTERQQS